MRSLYGGRGTVLEELINNANRHYIEVGLGCIQKIPTPIKVLELKQGMIIKGFFEEKSTVDYIGVIQSNPVCFDAKESKIDTYALKNIHSHQINYMNEYAKQQGIAYIILMFTTREEAYLIPLEYLNEYIKRQKNGGRKSITYKEIPKKYKVELKKGMADYLPALGLYIEDQITHKINSEIRDIFF